MIKDFNYLMVIITRQLRSVFKNSLKNSPLTYEQIRALIHISHYEGVSQKELAELMESKPMATSKLVDVLESLLLINRLKDQKDRRSYNLYLTASGKNEVEKILILSTSIFQLITKDIDDKDILACKRTLEKIQKNLQELKE